MLDICHPLGSHSPTLSLNSESWEDNGNTGWNGIRLFYADYRKGLELGTVAQAFNPGTWEAEAGKTCKFEVILVSTLSSSTVKVMQRDPI